MIGQCRHCGDPAADLKLNKLTDEVVCSNSKCMQVKEDATQFFKKALRDQRDYIALSEPRGNTLFCTECQTNTPSSLEKVTEFPEGVTFKTASNEDRYSVKCTNCNTAKEVNSFMLNAMVETYGSQQVT